MTSASPIAGYLAAALLLVTGCGEPQPVVSPAPAQSRETTPAQAGASEGREAADAPAAGDPSPPPAPAGSEANPATTAALPSLAVQNAAWVADVSQNVAYGLQALSCTRMSRDTGPEDLFGHATFVACGPPRLCSAGPDGERGTQDDSCTELEEGESTAPRDLGEGWDRRFLVITSDTQAPGLETPEAAIVTFYAGALRGDGSHRRAAPPEASWDDTTRYRIERHDDFPFDSVRLDGLSCYPPSHPVPLCRFRVYFDRGGSGGSDEGTVSRDGAGKWRMTRPPT